MHDVARQWLESAVARGESHGRSLVFLPLIVTLISGSPAVAQSPSLEAETILKRTGIRGGLCLILGVDSPALGEAFADNSSFYVQLLQPNQEAAQTWGVQISRGNSREQLGVRGAPFEADHYDSELFNLIVVEDSAALGKARLSDVSRLLVSGGVVVFRKRRARDAAVAKQLGMDTVAIPGWELAYRQSVRPIEWKLPLDIKWQAGPRTQIANGYTGVTTSAGKLFYMERMEIDEGDLNTSAAVVFARDARNGRTIWTWEAPGGWNLYNGLAATSDGRLFVRTGDGRVSVLDSGSGEVLSEVVAKVHREARISLLNDDLLLVAGDVYSTKSGNLLWKFPRFRYQPIRGTVIGKTIFFCDGTTLQAKNLTDGTEVWTKPVPALPATFESLSMAGDYLLIRMKSDARRGGPRDEFPVIVLNPTDGSQLWSYTWKVRISKNERYFDAGRVRVTTVGDKLLLYYRHNQEGSYDDEVVATRLDLATGDVEIEDRVLRNAGDFHGCFPELQLGNYIAYYDLWIDKKTLTATPLTMPHPACFFGMNSGSGLVYNFPSRKSGPISAVGPADAVVEGGGSGKTIETIGRATTSEDTTVNDWPMFRGSAAGGNFTRTTLGPTLVKAWESQIGLGGTSFGVMSSQRTGLTQAVIAYGLVVVADIDGQRIVALDHADGEEKWVFPVGSRVDYPPTLYKGLCLFAARDGWVYCLDARTGGLVYRLLAAPGERYIGGQEKLESKWALTSDVLIAEGVAYVSYTGGDFAFRPETGEAVDAADPGEIPHGVQSIHGARELQTSYELVTKGNSIPRTNEDNWGGFRRLRFGRRLDARVLAFDDKLTVACRFKPKGEGWANTGPLHLTAIADDPTNPLWTSDPIELVVDDIVLASEYVFCAGHYQRIRKSPELWTVSRKNGAVVSTVPLDNFPAFLGMSAFGSKLFIATREGKLLCYQSRK
jgi:outer membrane protein assembly factor BamB